MREGIDINQFLEEHRPYMLRIAQFFTKDLQDAEDICQEAMVKAFQTHEPLKEKEAAESWLYQIVSRTYFNELRSRKADKNQPVSATESLDTVFGRSSTQRTDEELLFDDISEYLGLLDTEQKLKSFVVFKLYVEEGLSMAQIAEKPGISEGTAKSNNSEAKKKLRARLAVEDERLQLAAAL